MKLILLIHAAATLMMAGAILIVQVVHYPLFNRVGSENFIGFAADHTSLITLVVGPLMLAEVITGVLLLGTGNLPAWSLVLGLILIGVVWGSTLFLQVPQHGILAAGFDQNAYHMLVTTNWIRTIAWVIRAALVIWWLWLVI